MFCTKCLWSHWTRADYALEYFKENPEYEERCEAWGCTVAHQYYGPVDYGLWEVFAERKLDEANRAGKNGNKAAEVEGAATPGVLLIAEVWISITAE
jgi:hypothetical protein